MNIERLLNDMTLDEKLGQMFLLAFEKHRLDEARVLFEEYFVGASYISNDNVPTPEKAVELTMQLQGYAAHTRLKIPLMLGVDQEGAWGVMVPDSCTGPGNMALGATHNPDDAYQIYKVIGRELRAVGLNAIFAPSADCNSNPFNSIIGMRAFGEKPGLVAAMTVAAVKGAHDGGIIATIKHFPGHGDTRLDSHRGIPSVQRARAELAAIDLFPFVQGIQAGSDMVMTSHIIFSALDPDNPATLSSIILGDVLRGEMGFEGVIISDSMNMQAILKNFTSAEAAIRAFNAGVDLLMLAEEHYSHNAAAYLEEQTSLIRAVKAAVESGHLPLERVNDAVRRVLRLKQKYEAVLQETPSIKQAVTIVGSSENRQVELEAARHAVAVLSDQHHHLPLAADRPLLLINTTSGSSYAILGATRGIGPNQTTAAFDYFAEAMKTSFSHLRTLAAEDVLQSDMKSILKEDELIIAVTENYPLPGVDFEQGSQRTILRQLTAAAADRLIVVALRDPYELADLPDLPTYVCAFSFRPCSAQAAVDVLSGTVQPLGKTPVSIPNTGFAANDIQDIR
jgi:beta-N-acetylhexosaminidase